jgi:hypothetical protein
MKGIVISDVIKTISEMSNAVYHVTDHILLLNRIKAIDFDPKFIAKVDFWCNILWASENTNCLIADVMDLLDLMRAMKETDDELLKIDNYDSNGKVILRFLEYRLLHEKKNLQEIQKYKLWLDIVRCCADMPVRLGFKLDYCFLYDGG